MPWPCLAAASIVLWCTVALPVSCGPSLVAGWLSFIEIGRLLSWLRMGRGAFLTGDVLRQELSVDGLLARPRKVPRTTIFSSMPSGRPSFVGTGPWLSWLRMGHSNDDPFRLTG